MQRKQAWLFSLYYRWCDTYSHCEQTTITTPHQTIASNFKVQRNGKMKAWDSKTSTWTAWFSVRTPFCDRETDQNLACHAAPAAAARANTARSRCLCTAWWWFRQYAIMVFKVIPWGTCWTRTLATEGYVQCSLVMQQKDGGCECEDEEGKIIVGVECAAWRLTWEEGGKGEKWGVECRVFLQL